MLRKLQLLKLDQVYPKMHIHSIYEIHLKIYFWGSLFEMILSLSIYFSINFTKTSEIWDRPKLEHDSFCNGGKNLCHAALAYSANFSSDLAFMLDAFSTDLTFLGKFPQYFPVTFVSQYLSDHISFGYIIFKWLKCLIQYATITSSIWIYCAQVLNIILMNSASYLWQIQCLFVLFGEV